MDKAQPDQLSFQRNVVLSLLLALAAAAWAVLVWQHADATRQSELLFSNGTASRG
jgi:predicted metal-binding membrane protein